MGGPCCAHAVLVREYRWRDVLRDGWRMLMGRPPLTAEECTGALVCQRCGQVMDEQADEGGDGRWRG